MYGNISMVAAIEKEMLLSKKNGYNLLNNYENLNFKPIEDQFFTDKFNKKTSLSYGGIELCRRGYIS